MSGEVAEQAIPPEAAAILSAFDVDLDLDPSIGMTECLGRVFRKKKRPSPVVQSLLVDLNPDNVRAAHNTLLQDYTMTDNTSLSCMKRVAATVWFVQLLLECRSIQSSHESAISEQEANKMALLLLQNLSKTIKAKLQTEISDDIDWDAPTVACFTIGAFLRVVDPYVAGFPFLLSPLWKGICDIAGSLNNIPYELADEALRALVTYLREGESQTMATVEQYIQTRQTGPTIQQQAFQVKVLTFLVARSSVLLRSHMASRQSSEDFKSSSTAPSDVATILFQLRGLTLAARVQLRKENSLSTALTEQDESFLQAYKQLEIKVEQCLVNCWLRPSTSEASVLERHDLNQLLRLQPESSSANSGLQKNLLAMSFAVGKALVLHRFLVRTVDDVSSGSESLEETDTQTLLFICEELLFSTLPLCTAVDPSSGLFSRCLDAMTSTTVVCFIKGPAEKRNQLDRLLIRWLAPSTERQMHPTTRELLISLVHLHALRLCQFHQSSTRSDSPRSVDMNAAPENEENCTFMKHLMTLLVKVLFDTRTQSAHRRNVASVMIRFLDARRAADSDSLPHEISVTLQQTIAVKLQQCIKQDVKAERRKRKKEKSSSTNVDDKQMRPLGSFTVDDVRVLMEILKRVSTYSVPSLDREMACLARDLTEFASNGKWQIYTVGRYSRNTLALSLALLCGTAEMSEGRGVSESFKSKTRIDMDVFTFSLVTWLAEQQKRASKAKRACLRKAHAAVIMACLNFIRSSFEHVGMSLNELRSIVNIVEDYTRVSCQVLRSASPPRDLDERRSAASIVFTISPLLSRITKVVPASCPADILQGIASTYKILFETKAWPVVACAVTSLVRFASTIPSAHQGILPTCISADTQGLLQCRLRGLVFRDAGSHTVRICLFKRHVYQYSHGGSPKPFL